MNKKNCKDALDQYKKFLIRMDRVAEFLKVAEVKKSILLQVLLLPSKCKSVNIFSPL